MKTKTAHHLTLAICAVADEADAVGPGPHGAEGAERARGVQRAIAKAEDMHHAIVREARAKALEEAAEAYSGEDDGEPRGTRTTALWLRNRAARERGER